MTGLFDLTTIPTSVPEGADPMLRTLRNSITEAAARRDEAITRADNHADPDWSATAMHAVTATAQRHPTFTTEDVKAAMPPEASTHEPRAWGAVMRAAAKDGVCAPSDEWRLSADPTCHRRPMRVWVSLIMQRERVSS